MQHSATANDGSFDTGLLGKGKSGSHTFDESGTFQYVCKPHPFMKGTITVRAASSSGGGSSDTGSDPAADDSSSSSGSGAGSSSSSSSGSGSSGGSGSTSSTNSSGSSSTLPNTGADAATLAILGLLMLALGAVVQRRAQRG